jgi:ribosomal protein L11 methyltransferase
MARFTAPAAAAQAIAGTLGELIDPERAAVAAFEMAQGWAVEIHFQDPSDENLIRALVREICGPDAGTDLTFHTIEEHDWVKASLEGLRPVPAGRFVIHGAHDRARIRPNALGIEIEAALAFGTGHHGTTRGCLLAIDLLARRGRPQRILDVGTGTGVLAIAAARRFRRRVFASDIDPAAVAVARGNARLNRVSGLYRAITARGLGAHDFRVEGPFDLVLANILLKPLTLMARPAARLMAPGGLMVLSGLLPEHAAAAIAAYRLQGLVLWNRIPCDGWVTLIMKRQRPGQGSGALKGREKPRRR